MNATELNRSPGMGAILQDQGVSFRVWAPNAESVSVVGNFNNWDGGANRMEAEANGYWYGYADNAKAGDEYRFQITNHDKVLLRIVPYAREEAAQKYRRRGKCAPFQASLATS